ncbi:hypothetical protein TCAL_05339 [Tigriopus californicus]|uniref:Mucin-like domain-containing protein n=1 Tax=Tigriopus californicus TaxID=6832 RepID=A0A553PFE7_TIGCA|nr:hypothetical protein TCAL_05339 [Tigriopus californicus]
MSSLRVALIVCCWMVSLVHSGFNPPDAGVASPFQGLGDLSQEFNEELEPSSDLETSASEQIHSVKELFRRRRKPITSKNDTAVNILLDKIKRTKKRHKFDPETLADVLLKRQRAVHKSRKNLFKPKPPGIAYLPKKGILFKKKEQVQKVLNETTTKSPDASFPYTFSSFPDVNVSSSTPNPIQETPSKSVEVSTSSSPSDVVDLTTEASNLSISTQSDLDFEPSPTMGAVDTFQPSTLDTITKSIAPVTPTLTIVTPTSVEPIEELAIEDLEVQPSNQNRVQGPSTTYVAPPLDGDNFTTQIPIESSSEDTTLALDVENEVSLEDPDTTEQVPIESPPVEPSSSSTYPTEEVPVSNDAEYFDLEKVITDSGGKLQETPKIRRKVSDAPPPVIQGQFLSFPPDHGYNDYKDPEEPSPEEEDPFLATQGYIDLQKIPEQSDLEQSTAPSLKTPEEVISTATININDPIKVPTTPGDIWGSSLDDQIIKAIEEVLHIDVPVDSKQLYRDSSPRFTRTNYGSNQIRGQDRNDNNLEKHAYGFEYSVFDENSGLTHSRQESGDENGVVTGSYEVLEPDCTIRRVTYRADEVHGFDVLNIERIPCNEQQRKNLEQTGSGQKFKKTTKNGNGQRIQSFQATYGGPPTKSRRKTVRKRPRKNRNQGFPSPSRRPQSRLPNSVDNGIKHNQLFDNGDPNSNQQSLKQYGVSTDFGKAFQGRNENPIAPNSAYGVILPNESTRGLGQFSQVQSNDPSNSIKGGSRKNTVQSSYQSHNGDSYETPGNGFGTPQGQPPLHGYEVNSAQSQPTFGIQSSKGHDVQGEAPSQGYGILQEHSHPQQPLAGYGVSNDANDQPFLDNQHVVEGSINNHEDLENPHHQSAQNHQHFQQNGLGLDANQSPREEIASSYGVSHEGPISTNNKEPHHFQENVISTTPATSFGVPRGESAHGENSHKPVSDYDIPQEEPVSGYGVPQDGPIPGYDIPQEEPVSGYGVPQEEPVSGYGIPQEEPVSGYDTPQNKPTSGFGSPQELTPAGYDVPQEEPVSSYGVPQDGPIPGYGVPQEEPVSGYGIPQEEPVSGYGIPKEEPVSGFDIPQEKPISGYGHPQERPVSGNGIPQQEPVISYGVPQQELVSGYGIPQQEPVSSYGVPKQEPVSSYDIPQENPTQNTGFHQNKPNTTPNDQNNPRSQLTPNHGGSKGNIGPNQPHAHQEPVSSYGILKQDSISNHGAIQQPEQSYGVPLDTPIELPSTNYGVPQGVPLNTQFGVFMDDQRQSHSGSSYEPDDNDDDVPPPTAYGVPSGQIIDSQETPLFSHASTGFFQSVEDSVTPPPVSFGISNETPLDTYSPSDVDPQLDYDDIGNIPLYSFPSSNNGNSLGSFQPFDLGQANIGSAQSLPQPNPTYSTESVPHEFQHPVTLSPTQINSNSFGGFPSTSLPSYEPPQRPPRPVKPSQKPRPQSFVPDSRPPAPRVETSGDSYDPFAFQQGLKDSKAKRKIKPENLGAEDQSLEPSNEAPVRVSPDQDFGRIPKSLPSNIERRNMLMNIILRPGGGDKSKALPRPRVDVRSEGPNVIIVSMTFPEEDDIKGLRAFTPTSRADLEQLVNIDQIIPVQTETIRELSHDGELQDLNVVADFDYNSNTDGGRRIKKEILPVLREPPGFKPPKMEVVVSNSDSVKYVKSRPAGPQPVVIPPPPPPNPPRRKRRPRFHNKPKKWSFFPF